jgi:two-component system chemotaxis response regulator CheY
MLMPQGVLKILLVAEIMSMRRTVRHLLRQEGYDAIFEVDNGPEALHMLQQRRIDLVIADGHLTPMSSLELVRAIRSTPAWHELPVFLMLSEASKAAIAAAGQAGVTQLLIKPFSATVLGEKIQVVFSSQPAKTAAASPAVPPALFARRYS